MTFSEDELIAIKKAIEFCYSHYEFEGEDYLEYLVSNLRQKFKEVEPCKTMP